MRVKGNPEPWAGFQIHGNGVEARDIAGGAVDVVVELIGVGTTIRQSRKCIARCVGKTGAESTEKISGCSALQRVVQAGQISVGAGSGFSQRADCEIVPGH